MFAKGINFKDVNQSWTHMDSHTSRRKLPYRSHNDILMLTKRVCHTTDKSSRVTMYYLTNLIQNERDCEHKSLRDQPSEIHPNFVKLKIVNI